MHDCTCTAHHLSTTSSSVNTAAEHAALSDYSPRDKPWDTHRAEAQNLQYIYAEAEEFERYAARINACSGVLRFAPVVNKQTGELTLKLREAQFCRVRTCPVCQWRRSLMWLARFYQSLPEIQNKHPNARWLFLTLTVRNCDIHDLRTTIKCMNESWHRLIKRQEFKPVLGWIRTTEVTRGKDGSAHPHFHALLMVPPSYFKGSNYLSHEKWTELWQESARLNYTPVVNIKAVKHGQLLEKAVAETLKYAVKPADITADAEWTLELTRQIHRLRFIASGGVLKDALKEDDESNEDLILADQPAEEEANTDARIAFSWRSAEKRYRRYPKADQ